MGASQFFAGAFLATDPPRRGLVRLQLFGWNIGTIAVAIAVPLGNSPATFLGAGCLVAVLGAYGVGFVQMRRRSLSNAPWASRWYLAAASFLAIGLVAGAMLAARIGWSHGNLLGAHMALNLGGWFGAAIVGTLHTFFPSLTRSQLRFPRLQAPTFVGWVLGVAALAVGYGFSADALAVVGWALLLVAAAMLATNVTGVTSRGTSAALAAGPDRRGGTGVSPRRPAGRHRCRRRRRLGPGARRPDPCCGVGTLIVGGWIGLTVVGSLLHLLSVLIRVRDLRRGMPAPRPLRDTALTTLAMVAVGAMATAQLADGGFLESLAQPLLIIAYLLLAGRIAVLCVRVLTDARPQL